MPKAHRVGDANSAGGIVTRTPQSFFRDNGALVSVDGAIGTSHIPFDPPHLIGLWTTANGATWFRIDGIPVNRAGDADTCGHTRASSGALTNING